MVAPVLLKPIPNQVVNEKGALKPFDLKEYMNAPEGPLVTYQAETENGDSLPQGLICTSDGLITGIPGSNTAGNYTLKITASNADGEITAPMELIVMPNIAGETSQIDKLKAQVWEALGQNQAPPDLKELLERPFSMNDMYYLLERWAILVIWDAFNLEPAGKCIPLQLEGQSPHYNVYDRGSSIIAGPKDLYSHERTTADALQTARAVAREVYKRGWTIEIAGFEKMTRAAWVELQLQSDKHGRAIEILHFDPGVKELRLYSDQIHAGFVNKLES